MREVTAKTADKLIIDLRKVRPEDLGLIVIELHAVTDRRDTRNATLRIEAPAGAEVVLLDEFKRSEAEVKAREGIAIGPHQDGKFIGG